MLGNCPYSVTRATENDVIKFLELFLDHFVFETSFCYGAQASLKLGIFLRLVSVCQVRGVSHHAQLFNFKILFYLFWGLSFLIQKLD